MVLWQWATGMVDYPYFHWRETGKSVPDDWAPKKAAIASVRFDDPSALDVPVYRDFIDAWLHDGAGVLLRSDPKRRQGDNVWLRARFDMLALVPDRQIGITSMSRVLTAHIDDNGARDIGTQIEALAVRGAPPEAIATFRKAEADEMASLRDYIAVVYKRVNGVDLFLHISRPEGGAGLHPVALWLHGGSWETGHWSYCPVFCTRLKELGFSVVQVEYRTAQRFDTTPLDRLKDGSDSLNWLKHHGREMGLDTDHLLVAGFSSGASLAVQLAQRPAYGVKGALLLSGCYDLTEESWYVRTVSPLADVKALSPVYAVTKATPPLLLFHARDDKLCSYSAANALAEKSSAYHDMTRLIDFEEGGHFFVFTSPLIRKRLKEETGIFVRGLRLNTNP